MSHEISIVNGREEAFYADEPAWHKLGITVKGAQTSIEAIKLAHLDWNVNKVPAVGKLTNEDDTIDLINHTDKFVTYREDTKASLGVVGNRYEIVQNIEAFNFVDSLIESGDILYESAMALKGGSMVVLLARFPKEQYVTEDDPCHDYILLVNTHDGSKALRILPTNVRVVCWNTLQYAIAMSHKKEDKALWVRHSGDLTSKIEEARDILSIMNKAQQELYGIFRTFASKTVPESKAREIIEKVYPDPKLDPNKEYKRDPLGKARNIRSKIVDCFNEMNTDATKGTWYGLMNAFTEYVDHHASYHGKNEEEKGNNQFSSIFFTGGNRLKQTAFDMITKELETVSFD